MDWRRTEKSYSWQLYNSLFLFPCNKILEGHGQTAIIWNAHFFSWVFLVQVSVTVKTYLIFYSFEYISCRPTLHRTFIPVNPFSRSASQQAGRFLLAGAIWTRPSTSSLGHSCKWSSLLSHGKPVMLGAFIAMQGTDHKDNLNALLMVEGIFLSYIH